MLPTKEQQEHFEEQGYIILRDVLSDELVSSLSNFFAQSEDYHKKYFDGSGQLKKNEERMIEKYNTALEIANNHNIKLLPIEEWRHTIIYWKEGRQTHPELLTYINMLNNTIGFYELLATLIHSKHLQSFNSMVWKKNAKSCEPTEVHRDYTVYNMKGIKSICAWISPSTVRKEHGALQVTPGSHKNVDHTIEHIVDKNYDDRDKYNLVTLEVEPKDLIIFDLRLMHAAAPNVSNVDRQAMTLRYIGDDIRYYERPKTIHPSTAYQRKKQLNTSKKTKEGDLFSLDQYPRVWPH